VSFLDGIRVIQVGGGIAAGNGARMLALAGADVIAIEPPGGDWVRSIAPFADGVAPPEGSLLYQHLGAGKRGIVCDLETAKGKDVFRRLAGDADLVVDGLGPGRLGSLGLLNPNEVGGTELSVVSVSNFGQEGPDSDLPATDITLEALGGLMYITGEAEYPPLKDPGFVGQMIAGLYVSTAGLIGVLAAQLHGRGHYFDVSIAESLVYFLDNTLTPWAYEKRIKQRGWGFRTSTYPCLDGYVGVFDGAGRYWTRFPKLMNEPALADEKFATQDGRTQHLEEMEALMLPWLVERGKEQIYHEAQALRLPFGSVRTMADLAESPHLRERGFVQAVEHPLLGKFDALAAPFRTVGSQPKAARAPLLGEHTASILSALGYSEAEIAAWNSDAVPL
jgi:CoA:oxalate CoA-transferase